MSTVINTNIKALVATGELAKNGRTMAKTMESLSTGSRINKASDDAAGLSIRENMTAQIKGLNAAVLQRMRELGTLAQNDTYSTAQRVAMNDEFTQLQGEIDRIADNTQWNSMNLLDGTGGNWGGGSLFTFQVGANAGQTISVAIAGMGIASLGISAVSVGTVTAARLAVTALDDAISVLNTRRSVLGSVINRLTHAVDNLTNVSQNASESRSRVTDTDYATATSELARTQIIQQAATAILAQANQQPQMVLSLLK